MPSASARRGRLRGGTDSLTSRLTTAITASLAGHSASSPAIAPAQPHAAAPSPWWARNQAVNPKVPSAITVKYPASTARRPASVLRQRGCGPRPTAQRRVSVPSPSSQWPRVRRGASAGSADAGGIRRSTAAATVSSVRPLRRAKRSMACRLASCVVSCSATKPACVCSSRIKALVREINPRQSA